MAHSIHEHPKRSQVRAQHRDAKDSNAPGDRAEHEDYERRQVCAKRREAHAKAEHAQQLRGHKQPRVCARGHDRSKQAPRTSAALRHMGGCEVVTSCCVYNNGVIMC